MISLRYSKKSNRIFVESDSISFSFDPDVFIESWNLFEHKIDKIDDFLNAVGWSDNSEIKNIFLSYSINPTIVNRTIRLALNPKRNNGKRKLKLQPLKSKSFYSCEVDVCGGKCRRSSIAIVNDLINHNLDLWNYCTTLSASTHDLSYFYDFVDSISDKNLSPKIFNTLFTLFNSQVDKIQKSVV